MTRLSVLAAMGLLIFAEVAAAADPTDAPPATAALGLTLTMRGSAVVVVRVVPNSPASRARIAIGDQIVAVDGRPVRTSADVVRIVVGDKVDQVAKVNVIRRGTSMTMIATLAPYQEVFASWRANALVPRQPASAPNGTATGNNGLEGLPGSYDSSDEGSIGHGSVDTTVRSQDFN